uniref:BHLH domain-containing protein n=1 Tax=Salarias fasciatus TaxID=181472 RepID=A0A672G0I2_SALFA
LRPPRRRPEEEKPAVEKKRRDRINSCIKQLKVLLQEDVHTQRLSSKLEKAEILEMTVSLLRQQLQDNAALTASAS